MEKKLKKISKLNFLGIISVVFWLLIFDDVLSCPIICTCKWKGGKIRVECLNKGLNTLTTGISSETQVLDYSYNQLSYLPMKIFQKEGLINLQKLYLSKCQISEIHDLAFTGLANLIELDLSNNLLITIPYKTFYSYPLIMKLSLSGNPIQKIGSDIFQSLEFISTLDLSNCQIEKIDYQAFNGLNRLQWLKLNNNRLKTIDLKNILPQVNSGISLDKNPWICDCNLREFYKYLTATPPPPLMNEIFCQEPSNFRMVPIKNLKIDDLACLPKIIPSSTYLEIEEGKNITFICQVTSVPDAEIFWEFQEGGIIEKIPTDDNNTSILYPLYKYDSNGGTIEKFSELFIINSRKENNGTFRCIAKNKAGISSSNFTLKVLIKEKIISSQSDAISYIHILLSSIATLSLILICGLILFCALYYQDIIKPKKSKRKNQNLPKNSSKYTVLKKQSIDNKQSNENYRKSLESNPDIISNTDDLRNNIILEPQKLQKKVSIVNKEPESIVSIKNEKSKPKVDLNTNNNNNTNNRLCYNLEIDGNPITLHLNPLNSQMGLSYPCGCFYPILNENGVQNFQENTEENRFPDGLEKEIFLHYYGEEMVGITGAGKGNHLTNCRELLAEENHNFRFNQEGYPFPPKTEKDNLKKLEFKSVVTTTTDLNLKYTPILSPPEPFKSQF